MDAGMSGIIRYQFRRAAEWQWSERDNFATLREALDYVRMLRKRHPATPYRIVERDYNYCTVCRDEPDYLTAFCEGHPVETATERRLAVEFVPEWRLHND